MRSLAVLALVWVGSGLAPAQPVPATVRVGDTLTVFVDGYEEYSGDFIVQADGSIYAPIVERLVVAGRTTVQVQAEVRRRLLRQLRRVSVSVLIKEQRKRSVAVHSPDGTVNQVEIPDSRDLRGVLAGSGLRGKPDELVATVFREGKAIQMVPVDRLFQGDPEVWNGRVEPDDVVVVLSRESVPVWVVGAVAKPGLLRVRPGTTVQQTVASAGGLTFPEDIPVSDIRLSVRKADGSETSVTEDSTEVVQPGDTVYARIPRLIRVSVLGWVNRVTDARIREESKLADAIAFAGGVRETGAASRVLVFRGSDMMTASATVKDDRLEAAQLALQDGDVVFVPQNQDQFYVIGRVGRPGAFPMLEGRAYRLSDALGLAQGIDSLGTPRRMAIVRPTVGGKYVTIPVDFDLWYRDGKAEANPEVLPGDFVFVSTARQNLLDQVSRIISTFLVVDAVFRR